MARQKGFCKILKDILKSRASETEAQMLVDAGFEIKNPTKSAVIMAALYKKAAAGDLSAIKELRLILGEQEEALNTAVVIVDNIRSDHP